MRFCRFLSISRKLNQQEIENLFLHSEEIPLDSIPELIQDLELKMKEAARKLEYETAADLRDKIKKLRQRLLGHQTKDH